MIWEEDVDWPMSVRDGLDGIELAGGKKNRPNGLDMGKLDLNNLKESSGGGGGRGVS